MEKSQILDRKEITLNGTNQSHKFYIGSVDGCTVKFSHTDANATDAVIEIIAGEVDTTDITATYTIASADSGNDSLINIINATVSYIEVKYTANTNTLGTGIITISGSL